MIQELKEMLSEVGSVIAFFFVVGLVGGLAIIAFTHAVVFP
jgi:hypothetical protein